MFIENEKKTFEIVTSLTEDQFQWLKCVLWTNRSRGIPKIEHPNTIDNDAIGDAIKSIRENISRSNTERSFELSDEELTELIQKYAHLERTVDVYGPETREYDTTITVPMDKNVDDLHHLDEFGLEELDEEFCCYIDPGCRVEISAEVTDVTTKMMFVLPTPNEFGVACALKEDVA